MSSASFPLRMQSSVVRGFGRGSRDLGIPTANLSRAEIGDALFASLSPGIFWGFAGLNGDVYKAAISVGYNPTYGNAEMTVEPHLVARSDDERRAASSCGETVLGDFYGEQLKLSIVGYIRPELPFEGLDKLIVAIKNDIKKTEELCDIETAIVKQEKEWCAVRVDKSS